MRHPHKIARPRAFQSATCAARRPALTTKGRPGVGRWTGVLLTAGRRPPGPAARTLRNVWALRAVRRFKRSDDLGVLTVGEHGEGVELEDRHQRRIWITSA